MMKWVEKVALTAKKNGLAVEWQDLKFGFRRAKISCGSWEELGAVRSLFQKAAGIHTESWAHGEGSFEGCVYVMSAVDNELLKAKLRGEADRVEDWWQRYHLADTETKRLMACGTIA